MNEKQGLFPSTYVERLAPAAANYGDVVAPVKKPYRPFGAAYHGMNAPPPGQDVTPVGLQEKEGTEAKKDKLGGYKSTVKAFLACFPIKLTHFTPSSRTLLLEVLVLVLVGI